MSDAEKTPFDPAAFDPEFDLERRQPVARPHLPRDSGDPLWVFGYGSLMWDPGFPFNESRVALLRGYHRAFCVYSHHYRGTRERPGLVLGLKRGGSCNGRAFRVSEREEAAVVEYLYRREMLSGVYRPTMLNAHTAEGPIKALTFIADCDHTQYAGGLNEAAIVERIRVAQGSRGPCRDYLRNTVHQLEQMGIGDAALQRLLAAVDAED